MLLWWPEKPLRWRRYPWEGEKEIEWEGDCSLNVALKHVQLNYTRGNCFSRFSFVGCHRKNKAGLIDYFAVDKNELLCKRKLPSMSWTWIHQQIWLNGGNRCVSSLISIAGLFQYHLFAEIFLLLRTRVLWNRVQFVDWEGSHACWNTIAVKAIGDKKGVFFYMTSVKRFRICWHLISTILLRFLNHLGEKNSRKTLNCG